MIYHRPMSSRTTINPEDDWSDPTPGRPLALRLELVDELDYDTSAAVVRLTRTALLGRVADREGFASLLNIFERCGQVDPYDGEIVALPLDAVLSQAWCLAALVGTERAPPPLSWRFKARLSQAVDQPDQHPLALISPSKPCSIDYFCEDFIQALSRELGPGCVDSVAQLGKVEPSLVRRSWQ
jgi:hypothetical protein